MDYAPHSAALLRLPLLQGLQKASTSIGREPSPGSPHGCRVAASAAGGSLRAFVASGVDVYHVGSSLATAVDGSVIRGKENLAVATVAKVRAWYRRTRALMTLLLPLPLFSSRSSDS